MNTTLGGGKAIHSAYQGDIQIPECGGNRAAVRYQGTDADVTCKRCLKMIAAREASAERTAYYAGLRDGQDMDLSQAEAVFGETNDEFQTRIASALADHEEEAPAPQPQREADPRTGLPIVTVDDVKYVVGLVQPGDDYSPDYVDFWLVSHGRAGFSNICIWRAYEDSAQGSVARKVWGAQSALRERNR